MHHRYPLLCASMVAMLHLHGQYDTLQANAARVIHTAAGHYGHSPQFVNGYQVPTTGPGPFAGTLSGSSLWIAGQAPSGSLHLAAATWGPSSSDYRTGPLGTGATISDANSQAYNRVWVIDRDAILLHQAYFACVADPACDAAALFPGHTIPDDFLEWPAMGNTAAGEAQFLAPAIDHDHDGQYNAGHGDYPCVPGDQALFSIFNDATPAHNLSGGSPLGVEVHMTSFAFASNDPHIAQTTFVRYRIHHRGSTVLQNSYIGIWNDFDLGDYTDDLVQCDATRSLSMVLNGDDDDETSTSGFGYGPNPPAFGMAILKGPLMDPDGTDNSASGPEGFNGQGFGDGVVDNERHGLSRFISFGNSWGSGPAATGDPTGTAEFYNLMQGKWLDGNPLSYGGTGFTTDPSAVPARFHYPGDSDPLGYGTNGQAMPAWTETTAGNAPNDRRALSSMGPFTLQPGAVQEIVLAYIYARSNNGAEASMEALRVRTDSVRAFAQTIPGLLNDELMCQLSGLGLATHHRAVDLRLLPNPATDRVTVRQNDPTARIGLYTAQGALLQFVRAAGPETVLDLSSRPAGLYLVQVQGASGTATARLVKE